MPPMNMLIVESNAKARTIQKYLGSSEWIVKATGGHVQDLPDRGDDPKEGGKAYWANRPHELPAPPWSWTENGEKAVRAIREAAAAGGVEHFFLATDPDREGEFIAWRLAELLRGDGSHELVRVVFQEVTRDAILAAIGNPRDIDMDLVGSAMIRRFVDRLVGFRTSKMASSILAGKGHSMGRVQTPTLGIVVEHELEREAHKPVHYFEVVATVPGLDLQVRFHEPADERGWRDEGGRFQATRTGDRSLAEAAHGALDVARAVTVTESRTTHQSRAARPAYTTDALLQAAGGRWGWSPRHTNKVASMLYEAGHITYIRTDSTRLAPSAIEEAREVIAKAWGASAVGAGAARSKPAANVQDAHEAIRPTRPAVAAQDLPAEVDGDGRRLYALIRAQLLASQMAPARLAQLHVTTSAAGFDRPLTGTISWYSELGWRAAFAGLGKEDRTEAPVGFAVGDRLPLIPTADDAPNPLLVEGETQPPARYRAHTLIKAMKEAGIGRPSTYASIVDTLLDRGYVVDDGGALVPTDNGRALWLDVAPMYELSGGEALFDAEYTARMEGRLDEVAKGVIPAPPVWEEMREAVRTAHAKAQAMRTSGHVTPSQLDLLKRLLEIATEAPEADVDWSQRTWEDAQAAIKALRARGIAPAATQKQRDLVQKLIERTAVPPEEVATVIGVQSLEQGLTTSQASAAIDFLRTKLPDVTVPSEKQLRFVQDLARKLLLDEPAACGLVAAASFADLTGGETGTASDLITLLQKEQGKRRRAQGA